MSHSKKQTADIYDILEADICGKLSPDSISSGFESYDKKSYGIAKGKVTILGSPSRAGKISMAQLFALNIMHKQIQRAYYFSADLDIGRIVHYYSGVRKGYNPQEEIGNAPRPWQRHPSIQREYNDLAQKWGFVDSTRWTSSQLELYINKILSLDDISCIVVDNIQLLNDEGRYKNSNRNDELRMAMEGLNRIAETHNLPVLAISNLRRPGGLNLSTKANLTDLDGGGCLEEMAGNVTYLSYNKRLGTNQGNNIHLIDVNIAKNRFGPTGALNLLWDNSQFRFKEYSVI